MGTANLVEVFRREFGREPAIRVEAPGRVNLIGEHTDYNDGFVLPAAIDRKITVLAAACEDQRVHSFSMDFNQRSEFALEGIQRSEDAPWSNYLRGVVVQFQKAGYPIAGLDILISGNVPIGAGLSSSAALEVACSETLRVLNALEIDRVRLALLSQAAEHQFVGVQCGIMDQFVSALAAQGSALFIDCRDLSHRNVSLPEGVRIVVCDTRVQRRLEASEYNRRRAECESAARKLDAVLGGVKALRDVASEQLEYHRSLLTELEYRRARHVVGENERVLATIEALEEGNIVCLGRMLYHSHESLRNDYEVSCRELDLLVELAREVEGTIGARMTGAGFGGCTVNLVKAESTEEFCRRVAKGYLERSGIEGEIYVCEPSSGVTSEKLA